MRKIIALLLAILIFVSCGITVFAANFDDGTLTIAEKDGKKFFGTEVSESCVKYIAANGSKEIFYDINGDKDMDISDVVAIARKKVDVNLNGEYDSGDMEVLRLIIIGADKIN